VPSPALRRALGSGAAFAAAFVAAGYVGRTTIVDDTATSLVWPAAGVAVLWLLATPHRQWWAALVPLALLTFLVNRTTGSDSAMTLVFVLTNVLQVVSVTWLLERPTPGWPPVRWGEPFASARSLMRLMVAAAVGCALPAAIGVAGQWLLLDFVSLPASLTWWARNAVGIVGVVATGLLLLDWWRHRDPRDRPSTGSLVEGSLLVACTVALVVVDLREGSLPLVFFLPALTVWAGMRFRPAFVATHSLAAGGAAVWLTLEHQGPFASVSSPHLAALAAQLFVGMTVVVGLFLAMSRLENTLLTADLAAARDESERRADLLRTIIMSMHDAVVVVDADDRVALANRAAVRTVLATTDTPIGTPMAQVPLSRPDGSPLPPDEQPSRPALGGMVHRADVHLAGQRDAVTHRVTATPLPGLDGDVRGAILVFHDISDERAQQEALSSFASTVAHDLLNPISAVSAWSELLRERLDGRPEELATLARIERSTDRMHALVTDLLADARAREFTLRSEVVDLAELARDVARTVPGAVVEVQPVPPVLGDPMLLQQVLANLIGNAVKYAAPDRDPQVCVSGSRDTLGDVVLRVSDRGIGIPEDHLESVFEAFRRVPGTDRPGTGLGLAICQRIVERHGGRIVARRREDGPGTVIEVTLPAARDDERGGPSVGSPRE
jgi:signal transduction histidine kinase